MGVLIGGMCIGLLTYHAIDWLVLDEPSTAQLLPDGTSDFGYGAVLATPPFVHSGGLTFLYPSMEITETAGFAGTRNVWDEYRASGGGDRAFPVWVKRLDYEPLPMQSMEAGHPRPFQLLRRLHPALRVRPSPIPGMDKVEIGERIAGRNDYMGLHVASAGTPYDMYVSCEDRRCTADVYSYRSRFGYTLEFPRVAAKHTVDLMRQLDTMIVSWAGKKSEIAVHYREHLADTTAPKPVYITPPACSSPSYRAVPVTGALEHPFYIAVDAGDNVYVVDSALVGEPGKTDVASTVRMLQRGAGAQAAGAWTRPKQHFDAIKAISSGPSGLLYAALSGGGVARAHGEENLTFVSYARLDVPSDAMGFDRTGSLFTLDFQNDRIFKTTRPGSLFSKSTLLAAVPGRIDGMAVSNDGIVYVSNNWLDVVQRVGPDGKVSEAVTGLRDVGAIAIDAANNLYVRDLSMAPIRKIAPDGKTCAVTLDGEDYNSIAIGPSGTVYATRSEGSSKVISFIPAH